VSLPTDRDARNALPVWDGAIMYFPDVWVELAKVSVAGQKQYGFKNLGWDTTVSTDHQNKVIRHLLDDATGQVVDTDGCMHLAKALWRIAATLQLRCWERDGKDEHGRPKVPAGTSVNAAIDEVAELTPKGARCDDCGGHGGTHFRSCSRNQI
jgi:hypothetical protein